MFEEILEKPSDTKIIFHPNTIICLSPNALVGLINSLSFDFCS